MCDAQGSVLKAGGAVGSPASVHFELGEGRVFMVDCESHIVLAHYFFPAGGSLITDDLRVEIWISSSGEVPSISYRRIILFGRTSVVESVRALLREETPAFATDRACRRPTDFGRIVRWLVWEVLWVNRRRAIVGGIASCSLSPCLAKVMSSTEDKIRTVSATKAGSFQRGPLACGVTDLRPVGFGGP